MEYHTPDAEIEAELHATNNPVTRSSYKQILVNRAVRAEKQRCIAAVNAAHLPQSHYHHGLESLGFRKAKSQILMRITGNL